MQVARERGISDTSIHQWRKEFAQHGQENVAGSGHQTPLEEENRRLKRDTLWSTRLSFLVKAGSIAMPESYPKRLLL